MTGTPGIYLGTDGGATTSKVGGVRHDGTVVSTKLLQRPTNSAHGPEAMVAGWIAAASDYLTQNDLTWDDVGGVGLAIPGPYQRYGVFGKSPNLPETFIGFDVHTSYAGALAERAGRAIPLVVGNDGNMGGVAEAQRVRGAGTGTMLMLAPGLGTRVRVRRRARAAARRRHAVGDGSRAHARPAAPARHEALSVRLRPDMGLRRGLHDDFRASLSAGRKAEHLSESSARDLGRRHEAAGAVAAGTRAEERSAGARDLRLPGARARSARGLARHGTRSRSSSSLAAG